MDIVLSALNRFTENYFNLWQEKENSLPKTSLYFDLPSPCIVQQIENYVLWRVVERDSFVDFNNVEKALNLALHPDIKSFYGTRFCADMKVLWQGLSINLIQVWSDEDLARLQENMIGHLLMQQKLKQSPTIFIASTDDDAEIISICNQTGQIIKEKIGTNERDILAFSLLDFLAKLSPEVEV